MGWLAYEWRAKDGRRVASYPKPHRAIYYPWAVYKSIKAIRQIAKAAGMR